MRNEREVREGAGPAVGVSAAGRADDEERAPRVPVRRLTREDVMTATEVAAMLALPKSTVYELARRGELPCARLGRTLRFLREDIEQRLRG
jgi:excisionase family DNA binding protein